jgi:hypothetical protein
MIYGKTSPSRSRKAEGSPSYLGLPPDVVESAQEWIDTPFGIFLCR